MIRILYFGWARDCAGIDSEELPLEGEISVGDLWEELLVRHPRLADCRPSSRVAVNLHYADERSLVPADAEVAIIPPVAGG